jgi:hypothetical protein
MGFVFELVATGLSGTGSTTASAARGCWRLRAPAAKRCPNVLSDRRLMASMILRTPGEVLVPEVACFRLPLQYDSKICVNLAALSTSVLGAPLTSSMALTSRASMGTKCGTPETDKTESVVDAN